MMISHFNPNNQSPTTRSASSKMDMSLFQTRKTDSWAKRGVTVATDNLSYFVEQRTDNARRVCMSACLLIKFSNG